MSGERYRLIWASSLPLTTVCGTRVDIRFCGQKQTLITIYITCRSMTSLLFFWQWPYSEFVSIVPNVKAPGNNEFIITMRKGPKKTDTMKFSTDHRADLLTEALVKIVKNFNNMNSTNLSKKSNDYNYLKREWNLSFLLEF